MAPDKKNLLIGIACIILGILVFLVAGFYVLKNINPSLLEKYLPQFFKKYVGLQNQEKAPQGTLIVDTEQLKKDLASQKITALVPKSKVSQVYYVTFNNLSNEVLLLDETHRNELLPLVAQAKTDIEKNDYQGLSDVGAKAKDINETQKKRLVILTGYFNNLEIINNATKDEQTKSMTIDLISTGRNMVTAFTAYSALIDELISGKVSAQTITGAKTTADNLLAAINSFRDDINKISAYFAQTLFTEINSSSSTSTKN